MIGLLIISHGSRNDEWVRLVDEAAAPLRALFSNPIYSSFLEIVEGRLIQDGIDELERQGATELVVVPLFISSGSTHIEEIAWALGVKETCEVETDMPRFRLNARVFLCEPIDAHDDVISILYEKLAPLSVDPAGELVLLVGHGSDLPGFCERWRGVLEEAASKLKRLGGFAAADGAMLLPNELPEKLKVWRSERPELRVLVVPFFISEGYFTAKVIPERLEGYDVRYNGRALLPHPLMTRWMEQRIIGARKELAADGQES